MVSDADGVLVVRRARRALEETLHPRVPAPDEPRPSSPPLFRESRGVFVTLKQYPGGELRGCIGYPLPVRALEEAIPEVAVAAALEDPRFPPVGPEELDHLVIEVSVLTTPKVVPSSSPEEILRSILPGRDGLIVEGYGRSGLLLPQVAPEQGWGPEELLVGTCQKAGLPDEAWTDRRVRVRRFEAEVFGEARPRGPVGRTPTGITPGDARPER